MNETTNDKCQQQGKSNRGKKGKGELDGSHPAGPTDQGSNGGFIFLSLLCAYLPDHYQLIR